MLKAGGRSYGLDSQCIVEVLPCVPLEQPPPGSFPVLCFHGQSIAVMELTEHYFGYRVSRVLTTRIVVVTLNTSKLAQKVGLVAEAVTETRHVRKLERIYENDVGDGVPAQAWRCEQGEDYFIIDLAPIVETVVSKHGAVMP